MSCTVLVRCQQKEVFTFEADERPQIGDVIWSPTGSGYLTAKTHCEHSAHTREGRTWGYTYITAECVPYKEA